MKQIICNLNLFDLQQKIMVADLDTNEIKLATISDTADLGMNIAKTCQTTEVYYVHLYGEDKIIQENIIPEIESYLTLTYGINDLEIEVN